MVCAVETVMLTPPFGINCRVFKGVSPETPLNAIFRRVISFAFLNILKLILLVLIPALVLWLPSTMMSTSTLR